MTQAPAGWYADPNAPSISRYWDGRAWTSATQGGPSGELKAPAGTPWSTIWIWLIVLGPLVQLPLTLLIPWESMFDIDLMAADPQQILESQLALYASPALWLSALFGWVIFGVNIWFAILDRRELLRRRVPKPAHWAWVFLGIVYPIIRSVVVKRRTGAGLAPMLVSIASVLLSFVISSILLARMFGAMFEMLGQLEPLLYS